MRVWRSEREKEREGAKKEGRKGGREGGRNTLLHPVLRRSKRFVDALSNVICVTYAWRLRAERACLLVLVVLTKNYLNVASLPRRDVDT